MEIMTAVQEIYRMNLTVHPPHALMCSSAVTMASALQAAGGVMGSVTVAMVLTSCNVIITLVPISTFPALLGDASRTTGAVMAMMTVAITQMNRVALQ